MKLRYALSALLLAAAPLVSAQPTQTAADPELVINSPAVAQAIISNYDADIEALPRPPYVLPDTSASLLVGYSVYDSPTAIAYTSEGVTGNVVLALTAGGDPALGCVDTTPQGPPDWGNGAELAGNIAMVARGVCSFIYKVHNARAAGAIGIIMYNPSDRVPDTIGGMSGPDEPGLDVSIPAMLLPWAIAQVPFDALANGDVVNATMRRSRFIVAGEGSPSPAGAGLFVVGQNPTSTTARLQVRTPAAEAVTVAAYNMLGQRVAVLFEGAVLGQQEVTMSTTGLPAGSYFIRAIGETFTQTQQITVVR